MRADYRTDELRRMLGSLQDSGGLLGDRIRRRLCSAARWNDKTGGELTDHICEEAENILRKQTDYLVHYPGLFELDTSLQDAFAAYEETSAMLGGRR